MMTPAEQAALFMTARARSIDGIEGGGTARGTSRDRSRPRMLHPPANTGNGTSSSTGPPPADAGASALVAQLLQQQVTLQQQLVALTRNSLLHECAYEDPSELLNKVDPAVRTLCRTWTKDLKNDLQTWATQKQLQDKYSKLRSQGEIHRTIRDEHDKTWQFPKGYKAVATDLHPDATDDIVFTDEPWELDNAWKAMRRRHAEETWKFVVDHQEACVDYYQDRISSANAPSRLTAEIDIWLKANVGNHFQETGQYIKQVTAKYAELVYREEFPKASSRITREKEAAAKREQALITAEEAFTDMDMKELLALAVLEGSKGLATHGKQHVNAPKDGVLQHLLKNSPELVKKYGINFHNSAKVSDKPRKPRNTSASSRARPTSRSASRGSGKAGSKAGGSRNNSRGRSAGSAKSNGSARSKGSSGKKGKGKGKGKRKGSGKSKGKGKQAPSSSSRRRSKTPHTRS